jgi:hypothetical protein
MYYIFYFINVAFLIPTTSPHYFCIRQSRIQSESAANQNGKTGRLDQAAENFLSTFFLHSTVHFLH